MKAENILINGADNQNNVMIKIIDFGISAKLKDDELLSGVFGTPYYIAPERFKKRYDTQCDLWSCGVLLYILCSGYPPFRGKSLKDL